MEDEPEIVKSLREEERLGILTTKSQRSYEELEMPDKSIAVFEDDMERKIREDNSGDEMVEKALMDAAEKYHLITERTNDLIALTTFKLNTTFTYVNPSYKKILGYEPEDLIGKPCFDFIHPDDKKNLLPLLKKYVSAKAKRLLTRKDVESSLFIEYRIRDKSGNWHYLESTANFAGDELLFVSKDITERKKAEEELLHSSNAVRMSNDSIVISDLKGNIIDANEATLRMYGTKDKKDLIGKNSLDLIASEHREKALAGMNEVLEKGYVKDREYNIISRDGCRIPVEMSVAIMNDVNGKPVGFVGITRNIIERKKAEEALQASEEKFRNIFEGAKDSLIFVDTTGKILDVNEEAVKTFGGSKEEVLGKHFSKLGVTPVKEIPTLLKNFAKVLRDKKALINIQIKNKKGEIRNLECSANLLKIGKKKSGVMIVARDVTDRKRAEEKIKRQNIKLKKLDRIKTDFLNVTSHELRTPMAAMKGYIQMLSKQKLGDVTPEQKDALNVVLRNTNRLDNLIEEILDISRLESGTMKFIPEKTDVTEMIREVVETMQASADLKNIKINTELEEIPELIIDQERIKQVLMNLVNNSIKFSPHDSTINLCTKMKKDNVLFELQDFGRGIPKNKQKKIFERFYQVDSGMDRKFGGVGLGLSISQGIVNAHGGKIWVGSTVGKGSIFKFSIPIQSVKDAEDRFKKEADVFKLENNK